jgi:hypothetical protein
MVRGGCLCGGVKFEIANVLGPFELCHCSNCRKVSGSAFLATVVVSRKGFRFIQGTELVKTFEAPVRRTPPGYKNTFCSVCGSPVPDPNDTSPEFEVVAGSLDDDPKIRPDKHIFVDVKSPWFEITDKLPQFTEKRLEQYRKESQDTGGSIFP